MHYGDDTIFIATNAGSTNGNPINVLYESFLITMVFQRETGEIIDVEINSVCSVTSQFVRSMFVGKSIYTQWEEIIADIRERYMGNSKKSMIFCVQDIVSRLRDRGLMPKK